MPTGYLHTMIRVRDLDKGVGFYTALLGMRELRRRDVPDGKYTLAFVGYADNANGQAEIELTHNWDQTEPYQVYYTINGKDPVPGQEGTLYDPNNPPKLQFNISTSLTIKAIVYDPNYGTRSSVVSYTVERRSNAAKPASNASSSSQGRDPREPDEPRRLSLGVPEWIDSFRA